MRVFPINVPSRVLNCVDTYGQLKAFSGFPEYQNYNRRTVLRCTKHFNCFIETACAGLKDSYSYSRKTKIKKAEITVIVKKLSYLNIWLREGHSLCTLENRGLFFALKQFVTSDLPYNSV